MEKIISKKEYLRAANADGIAIFEGTAGWCPQCKAIAPKVEELRQKWPDVRCKYIDLEDLMSWHEDWQVRTGYEYDVEKVEDVAQELGVKVMPTFTIFKDGDLEDSITGAKPAKLEEAIASLMKWTGSVEKAAFGFMMLLDFSKCCTTTKD